jgi:hypothetical protein
MAATAATTELGTRDGDDLDAGLAQQRVGVDVAVVGKDDSRGGANEVGAAVPLGAFVHVGRPTSLSHSV